MGFWLNPWKENLRLRRLDLHCRNLQGKIVRQSDALDMKRRRVNFLKERISHLEVDLAAERRKLAALKQLVRGE